MDRATTVNIQRPPKKAKEERIPVSRQKLTDKKVIQHEVTLNTCLMTAIMYDHDIEDGDYVSIFMNDSQIVDSQMIHLKRNGVITRVIQLDPNKENLLVSKAWNLGTLPPNTLTIDVFEGDVSNEVLKGRKPTITKQLESKPNVAGTIRLKCKP
jgi:hypothetical protein